MSDAPLPTTGVPQWDLADRLRKALRHGGVGVGQMAEYLDVDSGTVSRWLNGRITPSTQTVRLVALRCGVPYDWLVTGLDVGPDLPGPASRCIARVVELRQAA